MESLMIGIMPSNWSFILKDFLLELGRSKNTDIGE